MGFIPYADLDPVRKILAQIKRSSNQDLARELGWSDAKTSRTVDKLIALGALAKVRDGQAVAITLPQGTRIYQHLFKPAGIVPPA